MRELIVGRYVGARISRVEDRRVLSGVGRYIDDVSVPGMLHAGFLRSPLVARVMFPGPYRVPALK